MLWPGFAESAEAEIIDVEIKAVAIAKTTRFFKRIVNSLVCFEKFGVSRMAQQVEHAQN